VPSNRSLRRHLPLAFSLVAAAACSASDQDAGAGDPLAPLPATCVENAPIPVGACEAIEQDVRPFQAASGPIDVYVDGVKVDSVVAPFIKNNRTYVEMAAIFRALDVSVGYESVPVGRITATRNDLKLTMFIGYFWGDKTLRGIPASYFRMDAAPFLAKNGSTSLNKIVVPASFVASATGAEVAFNGNVSPKRVDITRGRTYFFDWNGSRGTYIQYTDTRNQMTLGCPAGFADKPVGSVGGRWCKNDGSNEAFLVPTGTMRNACLAAGQSAAICDGGRYNADLAASWRGAGLCTVGAAFDDEAQACVEAGSVLGPFPSAYRDRCAAMGLGSLCSTNRWRKADFLAVLDTADVATPLSQSAATALLTSNPELYGVTNEQNEIVSAGLYSRDGSKRSDFQRSEAALPPFVLSARRQTDQMARTAYLLLPASVRQTTAFVFVDRLAQSPEIYIPYLAKKQRVILIGTFMGLGGIKARDDAKHNALKIRHARELFKLRASVALVKSMGLQVTDVLWSIGDTHTDDPALQSLYTELATTLQSRYDRIMDAAGLAAIKRRLSYGGDELALVAFAQAAGAPIKAYVEYTDPNAKPRYDGGATAAQLVASKFAEAGVTVTATPADAAFEFYVISRPPETTENLASLAVETQMAQRIQALPAARRAKAYIVDMRYPNGAVNADMVPPSCDYLGFSGWGTGANAIGTAVGTAKLLTLNGNRDAAKRLLLEAVAFDVFANGYKEAQRGELRARVNAKLAPLGLGYNHHPGYAEAQADSVFDVFKIENAFVNERMKARFGASGCLPAVASPIRITAQFWRHFEAESHLIGQADGFFVPGLYRTGVVPGATAAMQEVLDPTLNVSAVTRVTLETLLAE
jgi:Protein of unknown function (DUF4127)/Copper amine oxidase N-terminal domain